MKPSQNLPKWYDTYKTKIDLYIYDYLDEYLKKYKHPSKPILEFIEVLKYSVYWGKRLRSILAIEMYLLLSGKKFSQLKKNDSIILYVIAIEIIHSFSLIHDDLPCMDNDEYRRGRLTVWKKFWEYQAVLAGDTLNTLAFEIISEIDDSDVSKKLSKLLSRASWVFWMVWGQIEDIYFETHKKQTTKSILEQLHNKKTGQIINASILWGIICAKKDNLIKKYTQFGNDIGLAFQIKDDLLDVEWTFEDTGKSVWWEEKWFVYILWIEKSKKQLDTLIKNCEKAISSLKSEKLNFLVQYIKNRKS